MTLHGYISRVEPYHEVFSPDDIFMTDPFEEEPEEVPGNTDLDSEIEDEYII